MWMTEVTGTQHHWVDGKPRYWGNFTRRWKSTPVPSPSRATLAWPALQEGPCPGRGFALGAAGILGWGWGISEPCDQPSILAWKVPC